MADIVGDGKEMRVNPQRSLNVRKGEATDNRNGEVARNVGGFIRGAGGVAYAASRTRQVLDDLDASSKGQPMEQAKSLQLAAKFALDLLVQGSLSQSPHIPSAYFPPLLYCTEHSSVFGGNSFTDSVVAFSFRDIGNLFVEDNSEPRAIPIQQVPDSDQDNVQDMGRSSGVIRISGRVFGQAGLARFQMLRKLCRYKGKQGLVFIDKNIGRYRVYPANIPGYTSSAEFFNQYVFQLTLIIVGDTNKKTLFHQTVDELTKYGLAAANAFEQARAIWYKHLSIYKENMDDYTIIEKEEELKKVLEEIGQPINDLKVEEIFKILDFGVTGLPVPVTPEIQYPEFEQIADTETIPLENIVPSLMMSSGYTDGVSTEYWLPTREPGEKFDVYYSQIYNQLTEDEILPDDVGEWDADRGSRIQNTTWKLQSINSDYTVVDSILRSGYNGNWTKLTFSAPPPKWGIIRIDYIMPTAVEFSFHSGETVIPGENLLYVDWVEGEIPAEFIADNVVPYPISGSNLNVIESDGVTELYIPEVLNDPPLIDAMVIKKRVGSAIDGTMEEITGFDVIPSTLWPGGKPGNWTKIILSDSLNLGDFVSINCIFNEEVFFYNYAHPDYTINEEGSEIEFKWLSRPRRKVTGQTVRNLVLSPGIPDGGGLYHTDLLTDGTTTVYWVKNGIDIADDITIKLSDGDSLLEDLQSSEYSIEAITSRPAYADNWAKITFNSAPAADRLLAIDCRLAQSMTTFRDTFVNAEISYENLVIELLWQEAVDDTYGVSTYKSIYPLPNGYETGRNGFVPAAGLTIFWLPKVVFGELYPLRVYVNRTLVGDYTLELEAERIIGGFPEIWTKITFDQALNQGNLLTVDFTAEEEQVIYDQSYLEYIPFDLFSDGCEPTKNELNTKKYYTPFIIDTSKAIEVKVDGVIVPSSGYTVTSIVSRTHENKDAIKVRELVGLITFVESPGDTTDIRVKYNRLETPSQETLKVSLYIATDDSKYVIIKDYYTRNELTPSQTTVTDTNNRFYDFIKYVYTFQGEEYITYASSENAAEFIYKKHDGFGETEETTVNKYSFEESTFDTGLYSNTDGFTSAQTTPTSLDILVPDDGQTDWIGRYNNLVTTYSDANSTQEREITSMLLGKLVDNADFSDNTQITDEDVTNAKLWLQIYNSYVESEDYVESKKMLQERTKLMELDLSGNPKEQDSANTVTIPNEVPIPVDLPPNEEWRVDELLAAMRYTKLHVDIKLYNFYNVNVVNLKTKYRGAVSEGINISLLDNVSTMSSYDSTKDFRIRFFFNDIIEEFQFNNSEELVDVISNGQTVSTDSGDVEISASELITDPEVMELQENQIPRTLNRTNFQVETFTLDKKTYEVFLLAIYGDIDATERAKLLPYNNNSYEKFQEIVGYGESALTLEEGLNFYKFIKITPVGG